MKTHSLRLTISLIAAFAACKGKASNSPSEEVAAAPSVAPRNTGLGVDYQVYEQCSDLKTCQEQCDAGKPALSCGRAGSFLVLAGRRDEAIATFERGCNTVDDPISCVYLADYYYDGVGVPVDRKKSYELYTRGCSAGHMPGAKPGESSMDPTLARGCTYAGLDEIQTGEFEKAFEHFSFGCDGSPEGCRYLAVAYRDGVGTASDRAKAQTIYRKACDMGDGPSCYDLATEQLRGLPQGTPSPEARGYFKRSCEAGFAQGCREYGRNVLFGLGGPPDVKGGLAILQDACQKMEDAEACEIVRTLDAALPSR